MAMNKYILPIFGCGILIAATAVHYATKPAVAKAALDLDPSASVERNCARLAKGTSAWLAGLSGIQEGSTFAMFLMGLDAVNTQATLAFEQAVPLPSDAVIGADPQEYRAAMDNLARAIEHNCQAARAGRNSPIYEMVRQSIEQLRGAGCSANGRCYILLKSDLDDDAHPLLRSLRSSSTLPSQLSDSLDNAGIEVQVCGTSELKPRRDGPSISIEGRVDLWRQMFTHPELVSTRPFCGQSPR